MIVSCWSVFDMYDGRKDYWQVSVFEVQEQIKSWFEDNYSPVLEITGDTPRADAEIIFKELITYPAVFYSYSNTMCVCFMTNSEIVAHFKLVWDEDVCNV